MKRLIAIILSAIMLLSFFSCSKNNIEDNDPPTPNDPSTDGTEPGDQNTDPSQTTTLFLNYDDIINKLIELAKYGERVEREEQLAVLDEREKDIYNELCQLTYEKTVGFSACDINFDGVNELVFLSESRLTPIALLTMKDGKPVFLDWFGSSANHTCAIDDKGTVYKMGYSKGENYYYSVRKIVDGKLEGLEFGCNDKNIDDPEVEYFKEENGVYTVISKAELDVLKARYSAVFNDLEETTTFSQIRSYNDIIKRDTHYKMIYLSPYEPVCDNIFFEIYDKNGNTVLQKEEDNSDMLIWQKSDILTIMYYHSGSFLNREYIFYDTVKNKISQSFLSVVAYNGNKVAYYDENNVLTVQNIFDSSLFYRQYPEIPSDFIFCTFSEDGKSLDLENGSLKPAHTVICFETSPIIKNLKICYIRYSTDINSDVYLISSGNPAYMRPANNDTARVLRTLTGGEYESEGGIRNDWYEISYMGKTLYVTADSFELDYYVVP